MRYRSIRSFPEIGVPGYPQSMHVSGIFPHKPSIFWDTPIYGTPHIDQRLELEAGIGTCKAKACFVAITLLTHLNATWGSSSHFKGWATEYGNHEATRDSIRGGYFQARR